MRGVWSVNRDYAGLEEVLRPEVCLASVEQAAPENNRDMREQAPVQSLPYFRFGHPLTCTYCGDPAGSVDHVIPVGFQHATRKKCVHSMNGPLTFACKHCNSTLGGRYFDSFKLRCEYVQQRLASKVKPILWSEQELMLLDYPLRRMVQCSNARRRWIGERADWCGSRDYLLGLENLKWQLQSISDSHSSRYLRSYFSETVQAVNHALYMRRP